VLYNGWRKDLTTTRTSQLGRNSSCMPRPPASVRPACTVCMPERAFNLLTQRQRPVRTCTHVRRVHIYGCTTYIYDAGCIDWAKTHSVEPMYGDSKKKPTSVYIYTVLLGPESYAHTIFFFLFPVGLIDRSISKTSDLKVVVVGLLFFSVNIMFPHRPWK
jgi:hypothetical protein